MGWKEAAQGGTKEKVVQVPAQAKLPTLPAHSATSYADALHRIYFTPLNATKHSN